MYETTKFIGFILFFYKKKIYKLKKKNYFHFMAGCVRVTLKIRLASMTLILPRFRRNEALIPLVTYTAKDQRGVI